jgi:hypothetical protein
MEALSQDSFSTKSGTLISFEKFEKGYYKNLESLKYTDRMVCRYLRSSGVKNTFRCQIFVMQNGVDDGISIVQAGDNINIYLSKDFRTGKHAAETGNKLIRALLLVKSGISPENLLPRVPDWLATGIYVKVREKEKSLNILPVKYYIGLYALALAKRYPAFRESLTTALSPTADGTAYELYEELCTFTLREVYRLCSNADNAISDIIILCSQKKYSQEEIFDSTVGRLIIAYYDQHLQKTFGVGTSDSEKLQKWFEYTAERRLFNVFHPVPVDTLRTSLKKWRTFKYQLKKDNATKWSAADILQLPKLYDEIKSPGIIISSKSAALAAIINKAPPLLVKPLALLLTTLQKTGKEPTALVTLNLQTAINDINNKLNRQKKIEEYLDLLSNSKIPPGKRFRREILEVRRDDGRKLWPGLEKYLDKVEKSFLSD